jgi:SSS family solute:Na+ symporter
MVITQIERMMGQGVLHTIDFWVIGAYFLVLLLVGFWSSYQANKKKQDNLFLAGRSLGWVPIGLTMWGTNVGPSMLITMASSGVLTGVVTGNYSWYAFVFIFLLAFVFAPRYLGAKVQTLPEFLGRRFGALTQSLLAWYTIATILISWLALTLFAGGILIGQLLGIPMWESVLGLVVISGLFAMAGGLKAIASTNVFQMALLILVSALLVVVGLHKAGGFSALYEATPGSFWNLFQPNDSPDYPWLAILLGYPIMGVWFWCTDQSMVQSVLGAKDLKTGQRGANFCGLLKILDVPLFILPGIICLVLFPEIKATPDKAYIHLVTNLFPSGLIGLVVVTMLAAMISTIGSALNSLSTVFTMDIYVRKYKPAACNKDVVRIGRLVTLFGAIVAIALTLAIDNIRGIKLFDIFQSILGFIAPPMTTVFLFAVLWKKTTARAVNLVLSVGSLFSLGIGVLYLWVLPVADGYHWPHFMMLSFLIFCALSVFTVLVTLLDKKKDGPTQEVKPVRYKTDAITKGMWAFLILIMIGLYIYFNGH